MLYYDESGLFLAVAAYQLGNTSSRTITEVKQRFNWLALGRGTLV